MRVLAATTLLLCLSACDGSPSRPEVSVEDAWVRLSPVAGRPGSAYFTLRGNGAPARLVRIESPQAERIELHETRVENGVSKMVPLRDVPVEDRTEFEAGGRHAMLFGIAPAVKQGGTVDLTFTFDPAPPVTVRAEVRGIGTDHAGH